MIALIVFPSLVVVSLVLSIIFGDIWWLFTVVLSVILLIVIAMVVHEHLHNRKFAASMLALEQSPLRLGGELRGELRTGVPMQMQAHTPYKITLQCTHRWETTRGTDKDRRRVTESETLWEKEIEGDARTELTSHQCVPIAITLPDDQPATSLGETREGIFWEMRVHLPLPGLDYRVTFSLPVLSPETRIDPAVIPKSD